MSTERNHDYYTEEYNGLICSACPLSRSLEKHIALAGMDPCTNYIGRMYDGIRPKYECALTTLRKWSRKTLEKNIRAKGGFEALERFVAKFI